ncbi:hypothetical protein [Lentzea sp.]|uniref:hypothetical protein n=1 Tax=Lentzea sp. TaxID=56099 RepID=UPI002C5374F6|nr:hypothetical protein [Lentzea sp.]HUQ55519.1 hypothetical protein [Lentzea sp.]
MPDSTGVAHVWQTAVRQRPAGRDVGGLGQFEHAGVGVAPRHRETAAGERDLRTGARRALRLVRRHDLRADEARVDRWTGAEQLGVDAGRAQAEVDQRVTHVGHESAGAAQVRAGVRGQFGEVRAVEATVVREVDELVARFELADLMAGIEPDVDYLPDDHSGIGEVEDCPRNSGGWRVNGVYWIG